MVVARLSQPARNLYELPSVPPGEPVVCTMSAHERHVGTFGVCSVLSLMMIGPNGNAVSLPELQKLVSLRYVRSNDHRSSIHRDTRTRRLDCVIGLDARPPLVDVPIWPQLHRDGFLPGL
jgi:hypothetical protein